MQGGFKLKSEKKKKLKILFFFSLRLLLWRSQLTKVHNWNKWKKISS